MKTMFNLTTSPDDLDRYADDGDLLSAMDGFDGIELMVFDEDTRGIVPRDRVIGLHMGYFGYWLDFWNGDEAAILQEFGSLEECRRQFGGLTRDAMLEKFRADLKNAEKYGAEYVVFHISDSSIEECFTGRFCHTDEEVVDASCELLNILFDGIKDGPALLLENLWYRGLTFTRPEITRRLLDGVRYENKGLMLDTGHLLHTNNELRTQEEGLEYINCLLDRHGELCKHIRGMHLQQSLTGEYVKRTAADPPALASDYSERLRQLFCHVFRVDLHQPYTCGRVADLVDRIAPDYLTFEFITSDRTQHREYLAAQKAALKFKKIPRD